jgi:large subunit ribosomal protein L9
MKLILQESYMNLGEAGDLVNVKPGYARNFLIPQKIAVTATPANVRKFEDKAKELASKKEKERENSKKTLSALEKVTVTIKKKVAEDGKLYGAVTTKDIEDELKTQGAFVDRRQIVLSRQIKMSGQYPILVKLVGGLKTTINLNVVSDAPAKKTEAEVEDSEGKDEA